MAESQQLQPASNKAAPDRAVPQTNPNPDAPAGAPDSVGAQSVRDGRPATCDDVVEALDEAGPGPK
jgi:hypothetical protein